MRKGLPWWLSDKESTYSAGVSGDVGSIPVLGRSLGEGMTTHSSILDWRISWTEEPSGLQSIGSHRVRHNYSNLACKYTFTEKRSYRKQYLIVKYFTLKQGIY